MHLPEISIRARLLMGALLILLLCGCGGGSHVSRKTGRGTAVFTIKWPAVQKRSRLIPAATNLIRIQIVANADGTGTLYASQDAPRPTTTPPTTTLSFNDLPPGQFYAKAAAYPETAPPLSVAQASALVPLTIADGQTTTSNLTMGTTITQLLPASISPNANLTAGYRPLTFMPQATDSAGNAVLLASSLQVTVSDSAIATVTDNHNGRFTIRDATETGTGTVTVTVTEPESKVTQSFTLTFAPTIFVSDRDNNRIVRIDDMNGTNFSTFGTGGSNLDQFHTPRHITTDFQNHLYVIDSLNNRLVRYDIQPGSLANPISYDASNTGTGLSTPYGVALDSLNRIYITDNDNHRIIRIDNINGNNAIIYNATENGHGGLDSPRGIAIDTQDRIYIVEYDKTGAAAHNRVLRIDDMSGAGFVAYYASGQGNLGDPHGVAIDSQGRIYIADYGHNRIVRINSDMTGSGFMAYNPSQNTATLYNPTDVNVDAQDRLYIGDFIHNRILRMNDITGTGLTIYGNVTTPSPGFNGTFGALPR